MRIALTNPYCWPHVKRGSESAMHGLATWLLANGHDVTILAGHSKASKYSIKNVRYRTVYARGMRRLHHELTPAVTMIPAMVVALRQLKPDVVHAFSYHDAFAARLAGIPYLISYAGIISPRSWLNARWQFRLFNAASRGARVIFTPSMACAAALERDYGFASTVIPYGLDTANFFRPGVQRVAGRIMSAATPNDVRKRAEVIVTAFGMIADQLPLAHVVFCATAAESVQTRLLELLPDRHRSRVSFLGNIEREALRDEYAKASVTMLTSLHEAFGLVIIESMAAGTPVVGARSGAIPELVDETVGGVFEADDVEGGARLLSRVLQADSVHYSDACMARAREYDWQEVGPRIVSLYQSVASVL